MLIATIPFALRILLIALLAAVIFVILVFRSTRSIRHKDLIVDDSIDEPSDTKIIPLYKDNPNVKIIKINKHTTRIIPCKK